MCAPEKENLIAAAVALIWANSPFADSYHEFWHLPLSVGLGEFVFSKSLHFWINDALMTIFFLVVGMEIRREIHEGALSTIDQATLPIGAAFGGVIAPALIYLTLNTDPVRASGWAVPVGLLAGIGFTMSIFIAMLAFNDERLLNAAKLGVLLGSLMAATIGTVWGALFTRRLRSIVREASECCPNKWRDGLLALALGLFLTYKAFGSRVL